jgi:hypothetical protein
MKLGTVTQQPTERLSYTVDYTEFLTDGDNLQQATAQVTPSGLTVDNVGIYDDDVTHRVKFWATGGQAGTRYKVELTVLTADGRILQDEVVVKIKEI